MPDQNQSETPNYTMHQQLNKRFNPSDVEWVIVNAIDIAGHNGVFIKAFASPYIKKEVAEQLADEVFGVTNWENGYEMPDGRGRIKYWIRFRANPESDWVYRYDGGSIDTDASGNFAKEAFEIALTFAEKRCWAKVGIGRYLKTIPHTEVQVSNSFQQGWNHYSFKSRLDKTKRVKIYWQAPELPADALPDGYTYSKENRTTPDNNQGNPPPPSQSEATDAQWKVLNNYYENIPIADQPQWDPYLWAEQTDEETGEVVKTERKKLSKEFAGKLITSFEKGYGKLNKKGVPYKVIEQSKKPDSAAKGVTQADLQDTLGATPEK